MVLNKLGKPSLYLPICMVVWGTVSASTAAVADFGGLLGVRFVLGFVEAAYFPGCLYFLSCWYTRQELPLRVSLLYSGSLLSGAFGGLIAAGIVDGMAGVAGLAAWQWLFLLEGVMTVSPCCWVGFDFRTRGLHHLSTDRLRRHCDFYPPRFPKDNELVDGRRERPCRVEAPSGYR